VIAATAELRGAAPAPAAGVSLVLRNLTVSYGGRPALSGVTAEVAPGGWLALIGPNGAGKSTLLRAVAGLVPAEGELLVGGVALDPRHRRHVARLVALVPQRPQQPSTMPVLDYVMLGRTAYLPLLGTEGRHDRSVVAETIERLDLTALAHRALGTLSGGEAQRATLARAIAQQAPLLLLDEPTSSLDVGHEQQVLELVDELRAERALTVLSAMHDLTLAGQYADELLLLADGGAVASGTPAQVLQAPLLEGCYGARLEVLTRPSGPVVVPLRRARAGAPDGVPGA
jgi:iron complex transport system ATP-binding protein